MSVEYDGITFERPGHENKRLETGDGTVVHVDPWGDVLEGDVPDLVVPEHDDTVEPITTDTDAVAAELEAD